MRTKLIKTQDKFILVSDEEHKIGDKIIHKTTFDLTGTPDLIGSTNEHWYKIIAGIPELPNIDFSLLSDEDCNKIGRTPPQVIDKLAHKEVEDIDNSQFDRGVIYGFHKGFKTAQSLNDKQFSLEDMHEAFYAIERGNMEQKHVFFDSFIQSLQQPKIWDVEVEMEECDNCSKGDACTGSDLTCDGEPIISYEPKITNNAIKVIKIL